VCIVEPGITDTSMARGISVVRSGSAYPQQRRNAVLFAAALQQPTPPSLVADTIVGAVENGDWRLRHLSGPDAGAFLGWRQSMTDEQWVEFGALDDAAWLARVKADFGMDLTLPD